MRRRIVHDAIAVYAFVAETAVSAGRWRSVMSFETSKFLTDVFDDLEFFGEVLLHLLPLFFGFEGCARFDLPAVCCDGGFDVFMLRLRSVVTVRYCIEFRDKTNKWMIDKSKSLPSAGIGRKRYLQ
jgi:hypothetical protein